MIRARSYSNCGNSGRRFVALVLAVFVAVLQLGAFAASELDAHPPTQSLTLNVGQTGELPAGDGVVFKSLLPDIAQVDQTGEVSGLIVGFGLVCARGDSSHTDYQIVVRAGNSAPVYNTRGLVAQAVSRGARALNDSITFRVSLTGLPDSMEERQQAVTRFLPQEDEIDAAFTRQVYFSMLMDRSAGAVIVDVTAQYKYGEGVQVLKAIRGEEVELSERQLELYDALQAAADLLGLTDSSVPDWKKALLAHDFLVLNSEYDERAAADSSANPDAFDAYGVMVNGIGVCQSYSEAFLLLMELAGIESEYVTGETGDMPHSWNRVMLDDGKWYNIDCTFDDPSPDREGYVSHRYFAVTDEQLRRTHSWDDAQHTCTATKYSYSNIQKLLGGKAA